MNDKPWKSSCKKSVLGRGSVIGLKGNRLRTGIKPTHPVILSEPPLYILSAVLLPVLSYLPYLCPLFTSSPATGRRRVWRTRQPRVLLSDEKAGMRRDEKAGMRRDEKAGSRMGGGGVGDACLRACASCCSRCERCPGADCACIHE